MFQAPHRLLYAKEIKLCECEVYNTCHGGRLNHWLRLSGWKNSDRQRGVVLDIIDVGVVVLDDRKW